MKPEYAILFFIIGTLMMMFLYGNELLLFGLMSFSALAYLASDKWKDLKMFLIAMLVGGACENLAVFLGGWHYANAGYLFAPLWLPVGWGMAVVFLEEAFSRDAHVPRFHKRAIGIAFGGTLLTAMVARNELLVLFLFAIVTLALFVVGFYKRSELKMAVLAAVFGTAMETACIMTGNWSYSAAMFGTPLWLPLCWLNAFLIMRRITPLGTSK